ncbi:TetR/AcrR family transcriptional regulator [Rhizorhabdus wittichii]|uniref:Transcriptional regulator, TetR family n=2 Tax=Rhizorhabdus wittichii TaxID=160791 RepID=A0A9J9HGB8_RHIWR|nr:TetR/AcrR family transcriptional regulator [Rhizorhabdus wittichii]ABQ71188.1 transcriptional regulator, TetR family [Rhizorhabdus wittichii RW1]ARR51984.1 TetR family transcriptional regulator [Rhizorhabdus wittichii DC-6]QTH22263.1 TetR/AcrR family transcriptional regulator [Rhizorhabdus wittichii]
MTDTILVQRARGRPRDSGKDAAIREAAWRILAERGFDGLTFEGVAELASCSRATLYRRYASKVELVAAVLYETSRSIEPTVPADAQPRDILIAHATAAALYMSGDRGQALLNLTMATFRLPELASATESFGENEREYYLRELRRLRPGATEATLAFACDTLIGGILYHATFRQRSLASGEIARLVDGAIALLAD